MTAKVELPIVGRDGVVSGNLYAGGSGGLEQGR